MEQNAFFCIYCGKQIVLPDGMTEPPSFCLYCGKKLPVRSSAETAQPEAAPAAAKPEPESPQEPAAPAVPVPETPVPESPVSESPVSESPVPEVCKSEPLDNGPEIRFVFGETKTDEVNADFRDASNTRIFTGYLPAGYRGSAKAEPNGNNPVLPMLLWAYAKNGSGKEWFLRKEKMYEINKLNPNAQNIFRPFDAFLDENAVQLLGTRQIRLLKRVPSFDEVAQQMTQALQTRKQQIESQSINGTIQYVVQGEYGAEGGKLYEAEVGGKKRYLLLHVGMMADEFCTFSPMLAQSQQRSAAMMQNLQMRSMSRGFLGGLFSPGMMMQSQQGVMIDTNPNTPFGMHQATGALSAQITWVVFGFCGFLSDTLPDKGEIRDFYKFINSLKLDPQTEQYIKRLQEQLAIRKMQDDQQAAQIMGQMVADQQRSFERRQDIMRDLNEHRDRTFQQMQASNNAAFDRRVRQNHEMIMGVNTYTRTDGSTVEASVMHDRVFQHENDPDLLIGAPMGADVPFGWTELEKLK